ncbi:MAG: tetratricopeptide repeat protein [Jatrophihabitans sp.]|uniref:tetratricopeptide repeat protein n=1 Tax=Jatrophihabitans sp. TaxID=1932789 RepID=UPI003F817437
MDSRRGQVHSDAADVAGGGSVGSATSRPAPTRGAVEARRLVAEGEERIAEDPVTAASLFARAARTAAQGGRASMAAGALEREVHAWAAAGEVGRARAAADRALVQLGNVEDVPVRVAVTVNLAAALGTAGFHDDAVQLLRAVEQMVSSPEARAETRAAVLLNMAVSELQLGQFTDASDHLDEAGSLLDEARNARMLATVRLNEAVIHSVANSPRQARTSYLEALRLYVDSGADDADVASALRGQAGTLAKTGRYREALDVYDQAIALYSRAGRPDEVFGTRIGQLMCRSSLGEPIAATELDGLEADLAGRSLDVVGQMSRNIGNARLRDGDVDAADRAYVRARRAFRKLGRAGDVASVDSNRAFVARARGDLPQARRLMASVRRQQARLGNWLAVANADVNLASLLTLLADQADPPSRSLLRAALRRAESGMEAVDRHRHELGTAADRAAILKNVYSGVFAVGIRLALRCGATGKVASFVERARVQPVLAEPAAADRPYRAPLRVVARAGDVLDGQSTAVLAEEACRVGGDGARWLGWWLGSDVVVGAVTDRCATTVSLRTVENEPRMLAAALPIPLAGEIEAAEDLSTAHRAALYRAVRGPLIADERTAGLLAATLPRRVLEAADDADGYSVAELDDRHLLWPIARMLFTLQLRSELMAAGSGGRRLPLVIAPPPELGRVPWAALPIEDPDEDPSAPRLIDAADVTIALPVSLVVWRGGQPSRSEATGAAVLVADPLGDLRHLRELRLADAARFGVGARPATRDAVLAAAADAPLLVLGAHVSPGTDADPASSAVLL